MRMENDLGRDPIRQLVLRIAIPSMLAQFVSVLYSVVDRMYIGNIPEVGNLALAGAGVCGPIVTMIGSVAFLVGVGGSPLVSIRMGAGDNEGAKRILANCFVLLVGLAAALMALAYATRRPVLLLFGASEASLPYAETYYSVYLTGTVFALLSTGMNQFIICQGFAKVAMKSVMLGAVVNIVLDPVFIFGFDMGVKGGALATVISQMASAAFVLAFLFGKRVPIRITFGNYQWRIMRKVIFLGLSPFLIVAFDNVLVIAMNASLQHYGGPEGDMLLTCNTIVQSFMLMVTMPLGGITGGTQSILGYNFGARRSDRVLAAQQWIVTLALIFTAVMFIIAQAVPQYFVRIFTREPEYVELTVWAIRVFTLGIIPLSIQYGIVDGYTGMGIAPIAISLSAFRKTLYLLGVFLIPMIFGVRAVFYTEPFSDFLGTAVSIAVYLLTMKKILRRRENGAL